MIQEQRTNDFCRAQTDAQIAYIEAERRVNQLKAENASLKGAAQGLGDLCDQLKTENAELRELTRDMWDWLAPTAVGGGAPLRGLHDRMRELGIES